MMIATREFFGGMHVLAVKRAVESGLSLLAISAKERGSWWKLILRSPWYSMSVSEQYFRVKFSCFGFS